MNGAQILVVDDDHSVCELFRLQIARTEWTVTTVQEAESALELLGSQRWNVLITDVVMPGMNGFTLIEQVKRLHPAVPAIVMTGGKSTHQTDEILASDCFGFVSKPIDWPYLIRLIKNAISISRRMQAR